MYRRWHSIPFLLLLALVVSRSGYTQDKPQELRVVMDLEKSHSHEDQPRVLGFGASCKSVKKNDKESGSYQPGSDQPISIAEWMGAPVEVVKVRRYDRSWKSPAGVRMRIVRLLQTKSGEVYPYEPWDEMAFRDIVATVQFSDHTEGSLELSGVHVCFSTHSGTALWLRVSPTQ